MCPILVQSFNWTSAVIMVSAEYIFLSRTCALWATNQIVVRVLRMSFLVLSVSALLFAGLVSYLEQTTYLAPGSSTHLTGCFDAGSKATFTGVLSFVLMLVFELETFCFTMYSFIKQYRSFRGRIVTALIQHSVVYFAAALLVVVPLIVMDMVGYPQGPVLGLMQVVGQATAVTRMQVHLWAANRRPQEVARLPLTTMRFTVQDRGSNHYRSSVGFDEVVSGDTSVGFLSHQRGLV
ncbi:hypothetical protein HYDPIDRAFT_116622 [Hydnomerulius pinastri MD-312]|uniref:Unplaced genomic scaffold scaffold_33, whole genome shotgun sequence n=1 Tax=Hydnomerulius pinastri MD-312 TaxID=994086 RepID=A0A0C9VSP7_9AGAM|nr:hypothetical protein HYDPIDRAFT_116622 [Hydnomerulius pinastri MD-312]